MWLYLDNVLEYLSIGVLINREFLRNKIKIIMGNVDIWSIFLLKYYVLLNEVEGTDDFMPQLF